MNKTKSPILIRPAWTSGIKIYENTYTYSSGTTAELILSVYDENGTLLEASSDTLSFVEVGGVKGFDITGKTITTNVDFNNNAIDVSGLQSGIYFVKFNVGQNEVVKKFIKK